MINILTAIVLFVAGGGLYLRVDPLTGFHPLKVTVGVRLDEHKDNRWLQIDVYCDSMWVDGSGRDVTDYHPPYTFFFTLRESCEYTIEAVLSGINGRYVVESQPVEVR